MNLPRSTYYHKPKNESGDDPQLINRIEAIIEEFSGYGYRRVTRELNRRGTPSNHKKVLRIMRERGLIRKPKRRWIRTTNSNHPHWIYPNLVQNLAVMGPNQVWAADITYNGTGSHSPLPGRERSRGLNAGHSDGCAGWLASLGFQSSERAKKAGIFPGSSGGNEL
jgi:transposase InsO family protein